VSNGENDPYIRELNQIHDRLDGLNAKINKLPDKFNDKMDEKLEFHEAICEATDIVKYDDNGNKRKLTVLERVKERPERWGIPSIIVVTVYLLVELGLI